MGFFLCFSCLLSFVDCFFALYITIVSGLGLVFGWLEVLLFYFFVLNCLGLLCFIVHDAYAWIALCKMVVIMKTVMWLERFFSVCCWHPVRFAEFKPINHKVRLSPWYIQMKDCNILYCVWKPGIEEHHDISALQCVSKWRYFALGFDNTEGVSDWQLLTCWLEGPVGVSNPISSLKQDCHQPCLGSDITLPSKPWRPSRVGIPQPLWAASSSVALLFWWKSFLTSTLNLPRCD